MSAAPSLFERRGRELGKPPKLPSLVPKMGYESSRSDVVEVCSFRSSNSVDSRLSTAASSTSASPSASPGTSPKIVVRRDAEDLTPLRLRRNAFKAPLINCDLVHQDNCDDPFVHSQCSSLQDRYVGFEKLGEGSCGVVYKVRARTDNKEVAIKVMRMDDVEQLSMAQKEYDLLKHVSHPNVIRALDFFTYSRGAVLVLDYFEGRKLATAVRQAPGHHFQEATARLLSAQLLDAVAHLHLCGVIHRDIKADNILISADLTDLRLVDFNAAKRLAESQALTMTGTVDYMPPEVLQGESPGQPGDVWAIGLCLYLMLDGRLPSERRALRIRFDSLDEVPLHQGSLVKLEGDRWENLSEACKDVLRTCLQFHCDSRPAASAVFAMPWLAADLDRTEHSSAAAVIC